MASLSATRQHATERIPPPQSGMCLFCVVSFLLLYCIVVCAHHFHTVPQTLFPTSLSFFTSINCWTIC